MGPGDCVGLSTGLPAEVQASEFESAASPVAAAAVAAAAVASGKTNLPQLARAAMLLLAPRCSNRARRQESAIGERPSYRRPLEGLQRLDREQSGRGKTKAAAAAGL